MKPVIRKLHSDEVEAVRAYGGAIASLHRSKKAVKVFKHIRAEEKDHAVKLSSLLRAK